MTTIPSLLNELDRRLSNMIRIGTVSECDFEKNSVRTTLGNLKTAWLPVMQICVGDVRSWIPPTIGEQGIILSPNGNLSSGIFLRGIYQTQFPAPSENENRHVFEFKDGTMLSYDDEQHCLEVKLSDGGSACLIASGGVTVSGNATITGDLTVTGSINSGRDQVAGGISTQNHTHTCPDGAISLPQ